MLTLCAYGQRLYHELFGTTHTFRSYLQKQGGARIVLRLHSTASELWNIPWEYIHDGKEFLAIQPNTPVSRYLSDIKLENKSFQPNQLPAPLRILVVISHPRDATPLNVDAEIARIEQAVADAKRVGAVEIDFVEDGTLVNLLRALKQREYHILHFSGHGSTGPLGSFLVMEDDNGMSAPSLFGPTHPRD